MQPGVGKSNNQRTRFGHNNASTTTMYRYVLNRG